MSKEIIDRIKQAEALSASGLDEAKKQAAEIVKEARDEAVKYYRDEVGKAKEKADSLRAEAKEKADQLLNKAALEAAGAEKSLKQAAGEKQKKAVDALIKSLS